MKGALANGQADTAEETLSLFATHLHRQAMEEYGREAMEENRRQMEILAQIEQNARKAACGTPAGVFAVLPENLAGKVCRKKILLFFRVPTAGENRPFYRSFFGFPPGSDGVPAGKEGA